MKKIIIGLGLAALLSSCLDTGRVSVFDTNFTSEFKDAGGRFVICDNRTTQVTISFTFSEVAPNAFVKWETILDGKTIKDYKLTNFGVNGELTRDSAGVKWNQATNRISYTVAIAAQTAPYGATLTPQAVIVNPLPPVEIPTQDPPLGFTRLNLRIFDDRGVSAKAFLGDQIRVVTNCPNPQN